MTRIDYERTLSCQSERSLLWTQIADSDRLNALSKMAQVQVAPTLDHGTAVFHGRSSIGPVPIVYDEQPFEFIAEQRWSVRRIIRDNYFFKEIQAGFTLADREGGGTDVTGRIAIEFGPRLMDPIARMAVKKTLGHMMSAVATMDRELSSKTRSRAEIHPEVDRAALSRGLGELEQLVPENLRPLGAQLEALIETAPDYELTRLRPYELAEAWGAPRRAVLELCLSAVVAGLLELSWDVVCPSCRGATERVTTLADIESHAQCTLCNIGFELDLDQAVEATFRPSIAIRRVEERRYCTGGPAMTPHVIEQLILPAGQSVILPVPNQSDQLRLFVRGGISATVDVDERADPEVQVDVAEGKGLWRVSVAPGGRILARSELEDDRPIKLEHSAWASRAATAYEISTIPAFRRMLSTDLLRTDTALRVQRATLLFTDLRGSTAFYDRVGDAVAFRFVQDHFDLISQVIDAQRGTVVKTIGDAVMAAFSDEPGGVQAAVELQRRFPALLANNPEAADVGLKIGLYSGPCYAVTANGLLDYFGQSVNTAARVEGQATSGDIVMLTPVAERALAEHWVEGCEIAERFEVTPKGLSEPLAMARLRVLMEPSD